ncbi:MAG: nucleotidyltransferase family protein [Candidatus Omnitrophota bacterium]
MKVLILAGGYGTRLYPIVKNTSKPLLEVQGKPIINYILEKIKDSEKLTQVLVVTNDKFYADFRKWRERQRAFPVDIKVFNDGTKTPEDRLGSIGDIHYVLEREDVDDDLLVVGGDNIFDFNLEDYVAFARKNSPGVSIGVYDIGTLQEAKKFGVVQVDKKGKVVSFIEKPEKPLSSLIAMCFYFLPKETLHLIGQYLKECKKSDTSGDYIRWLSQKSDVYAFKFQGQWYDIGSIESYREAQERFSK